MKGVLLLSDGIDSPVAGYMMLKQELSLIFLHFRNSDDKRALLKVRKLAKRLCDDPKIVVIDHIKTQKSISAFCNRRYQCVLCKRAMYRAAEKLAKEEGAQFIVTGENLGQVASQTLENLGVLDSAVSARVLRPLLGLDKNEIIAIAKKIGTYDISIMKTCGCSYVPKNPVTMADIRKVLHEESLLKTGSRKN